MAVMLPRRYRRRPVEPALEPEAPKSGRWSAFFAGVTLREILVVAAMLGGGTAMKVQTDHKVEQAADKVEQVEQVARASRGRTRVALDSLTARMVRDSTAWRREMRAMRREVAALRRSRPAALNGPPAPVEASGDDDEDDEPFGPAPAPAAAEKSKGKAGGVFGWFKRNLGGG